MRTIAYTALAAAVVTFGACRNRAPAAFGEANSIIVATPDTLWAEIDEGMRTALEPRVFTVRDERTFELTHVSPTSADWRDLRKFKQVLVIGQPTDPWVEPAVDGRLPDAEHLPAIVENEDVWALGQRVTAVVMPPEGDGEAVNRILPALHEHLDARYRTMVRQRMFTSGVDEALRDTLRREAGFSLTVPTVYRWERLDSATYIFRNIYPDPSQLIRSILVTWRPGAADTVAAERTLAWRDTVSDRYYEYFNQATERDRIETRPIEDTGGSAIQVQGIWSNEASDWPAAGPFISRMVACPAQDRTYLLDAWLYAPGEDKYQYMIQLETILDSFECGSRGG